MTSQKDSLNNGISSATDGEEALAESAPDKKGASLKLPTLPKPSSGAKKTDKRSKRATLFGIGEFVGAGQGSAGAPPPRRGFALPVPKPRNTSGSLSEVTEADFLDDDALEELEEDELVEEDAPEDGELVGEEDASEEAELAEESADEASGEEIAPVDGEVQTEPMSAVGAAAVSAPATIQMSAPLFEQESDAQEDEDAACEDTGPATLMMSAPVFEEEVEPAPKSVERPTLTLKTAPVTRFGVIEAVEVDAPVSRAPEIDVAATLDGAPGVKMGVAAIEAAVPAPSTDDFEGEKTEVFNSPFQHEVLSARLSTLSGPCAGQEFLLNRERNTLGRGQHNTIMLTDLAMSRQHFEVRRDAAQGYLLFDLQSANGTRLNHTPIIEAELRHGDRLEAGKSEFQFVLPGNHAPARSEKRHIIVKREANAPKHPPIRPPEAAKEHRLESLLTWIIRVATVLSVVLIATMLLLFFNPPARTSTESVPGEASAEAQRVQLLYLEGVEKVKDRDWAAAHDYFKQVEAVDAGFANVGAQLSRVANERAIAAQLERARALFAQGDFDESIALAAAVTIQSVYVEDAQHLLREAKQHRVAARVQQAQQALSDEAFDAAKAHLDAVLAEVPNHQGALELQEILQGDAAKRADKIDAIERKKELEKRRAAARTSASNSAPRIDWFAKKADGAGQGRDSADSAAVKIDFTRGYSLYRNAKFSQAAAYFRDAGGADKGALARRALQSADAIDAFAALHARAKRALGAKDWTGALKELEHAHAADKKVASTAYLKRTINADMATAYANIGLAAAARSDFKVASQNYKKGYQLQSSNKAVGALSRELSRRANSLYIQAAGKRKKDPAGALKLCQEIVSILASHHELYDKAKTMMAELQ